MRFSQIDLLNDEGELSPPPQELDPEVEALLQPYFAQSFSLRSVIAVGCGVSRQSCEDSDEKAADAPDAVLLRLLADDGAAAAPAPSGIARNGNGHGWLECLAQRALEICGVGAGGDLLMTPAHLLDELPGLMSGDSSFRAVAVLWSDTLHPETGDHGWKLQRRMFDMGYLCIGSAPVAGWTGLCFLESSEVRAFDRLHAESRGHISMAELNEGAGFANQLFRYAFAKLYALRHGLTPALPEWEGGQLFGLSDESCAGLTLPKIVYPGFAETDREMWDLDDPPAEIEYAGYFQEIPECWRKQRPLLRRTFTAPEQYTRVLDAWRDAVTHGGRRTLVAIHVRRGDYRDFQSESCPWLRLVPEEWYLQWLREIWPKLHDPVLFVATDEPKAVLPAFREFRPTELTPGPVGGEAMPDYLRDFEMLRRADYLAICNSSYSRMAAILGPDTQKCFIPSFETQRFTPYEPWIDPGFWKRFSNTYASSGSQAAGAKAAAILYATVGAEAIFFDVTDLVVYLLHQSTLSGIQRVQAEILRNLPATQNSASIRFAVIGKRGGVFLIDHSALLNAIENLRTDAAPRAEVDLELKAMLNGAVPCTPRAGDIFMENGAFWNIAGTGRILQQLKNSGVRVGVFIHDMIPVEAPEYFEAGSTSLFVKAMFDALSFADFALTASQFNKTCLEKHMASIFGRVPIGLAPLAHELSAWTPADAEVSPTVADILEKDFVLCVGTIEVRKNPSYLLNIWKMMVRSGRPNVPRLVFVGRQGWLVEDFLRQLKACNHLGGKIVVAHGVTDAELNLLYRECLLTMFPSYLEGWGLPVGESLAHGKICLSSAAGGTPEVGGDLVDYIDPYNVRDGLEKLARYLDDPALRAAREHEIAVRFRPRSWQEASEIFLRSTRELARQARPSDGAALVELPPDRYMPIGSDPPAILMDDLDGRLSAELCCLSGWLPLDVTGARAAQPEATIRFRTPLEAGTKINLVLRLTSQGRDARIRICSGSGAETEVSVTTGTEKTAVLSCAVEDARTVTAHLLSIGATVMGDAFGYTWTLKGILYFDPKGGAVRQAPAAIPQKSRVSLVPAEMSTFPMAASLDAFVQTANSSWPLESTTERKPPLFADEADRQTFFSGCGDPVRVPRLGKVADRVTLYRRSDVFVSMSRFSEGSIFDRSRVWRACGYLSGQLAIDHALWLQRDGEGVSVSGEALAKAPFYDGACLVFYNGNLHNYYHWVVEGLLGLDVLTRVFGLDGNFQIALPKSMDIAEVFDHRGSLPAIGLGASHTSIVDAPLRRVREAIWVDSDQVQLMPATYLKDFQRRIAALYAGMRLPRKRRLLVARKGPTRMIQNLAEVEAALAARDFETVYLEGMSPRDQILLFQNAEFIITPHGAGMANLLFCDPGTKVIELSPSAELRDFFWEISEKLGLVHGLQFCTPVERPEFQASIHVDTGKLDRLVRMLEAV